MKKEKFMQIIKSNDPEAKDLNPPAPEICNYCGKARYTEGLYFGGRDVIWMNFAEPCTCHEAVAEQERLKAKRIAEEEAEKKAAEDRRLQERIRKIIGNSGMGERFLRRTFDNFELTEDNKAAAAVCRRYANNFESLLPNKNEQQELDRNGLFISGPAGTGKTHLAAAIANQLMRGGTPAICMTMIDLLERIKRTFSSRRLLGIDEGEILSVYKTVPILVIDDMGKEPPTEWAISTIYNIVNGRYEGYMPTIITTNYSDQALISRMTPQTTRDSITAEATIDRLMEMCKGIVLTGPSWRQK